MLYDFSRQQERERQLRAISEDAARNHKPLGP